MIVTRQAWAKVYHIHIADTHRQSYICSETWIFWVRSGGVFGDENVGDMMTIKVSPKKMKYDQKYPAWKKVLI